MSTALTPIEVDASADGNGSRTAHGRFMPYARDERLARPWALPGTPGLMHRIGGLEKQDITGNVNYEPDNHQHMVNLAGREGGRHRPGYCRRKKSMDRSTAGCWC